MPVILLTVTNDLTYDQRMHRIAGSLAAAGYQVELIGRKLPESQPLENLTYKQTRLRCRFRKGFLFYLEYNIRLFFYLLFSRFDAVGTVDLDTLPAGALASLLRGKARVFDAHEYFTEVPEVTHRRFVKSFWTFIAWLFLPLYKHAYTVGPALAALFEKKYNLPFAIVRNVPRRLPSPTLLEHQLPRILLYQGALNQGRGIESTLEALQLLDPGLQIQLWLAGEGDLSQSLRDRSKALGLQNRVRFLGYVKPADLKAVTAQAWVGLNLLENRGLSYYYSLANKFFDYVQAGVPALNMNFPEYAALNARFEVSILLNQLQPEAVAAALTRLASQPELYRQLQQNCMQAAEEWNWEKEEGVLLDVWEQALEGLSGEGLE